MGVARRLSEGENVFQVWREETALSQRKLARLSGVDYDRISLFEYGLAAPHSEELEALAKALRVTPDLLMPPTEPADGEPV
jgi:transcriptional regulator with XRE-family HTH domain